MEPSSKCLAYYTCLINVSDAFCYKVTHMTSHSLIPCPQFLKLLYLSYSKLPLITNHTIDLTAAYHKNKEIITHQTYGRAVQFDGFKYGC